jgi:ArsR family transcriptional regulator
MDILTLSRALSSPSRLYLLQSMGETGMSVTDLASSSGLVPSTVCHHVKQLVEVGLAVRKRKGRHTFYKWAPTRMSIYFEQAPSSAPSSTP